MALPAGSVLKLDIEKRVCANSARHYTKTASEEHTTADNADLSTGDIDFCFWGWIYCDTVSSSDGVLAKVDGGTNNEYFVGINSSGAKELRFVTFSGATPSVALASTFGVLSTSTWYFFYCYHDATANEIGISINGGTIDTTAVTTGVNDDTNTFDVGNYNSTFWDGRICQLGYAKKVLTATEVASFYNGGVGKSYEELTAGEKTSLVSYWPGQEEAGDLIDAHGSNDLTDTNTVESAEGVNTVQGIQFDGAADYLSRTNDTILAGTDAAGWWRAFITDGATAGDWAFAVGASGAGGIAIEYINNAIQLTTKHTGGTDWWNSPSIPLVDDDLNLVYVGWDGSDKQASVRGDTIDTKAVATAYDPGTTGTFYMGQRGNSSAYVDRAFGWFIGGEGVLTQAQVDWLWNGGACQSWSDIVAAAARGTGDGSAILAACTFAWPMAEGQNGVERKDVVGTLHLTDNNTVDSGALSTTTPADRPTERLLTDVSAAGINYAGSDTCKVYRREDLSGEDNHMSNSTFSTQPEYDPTALGAGAPGVQYGNSTKLTAESAITVATSTGDWSFGSYVNLAASGNDYWFQDGVASSVIAGRRSDGKWAANGLVGGTNDGDTHVWLGLWDGADLVDDLRIDASSITLDTGEVGLSALTPVHGEGAGANASMGAVGNFALWLSTLTGTDRTDAEEWFQYGDAGAPGGGTTIPAVDEGMLVGGMSVMSGGLS